jgi:hypothetical protein
MTTLSPTHSLPTAEEVAIARESGRALSAFLQTRAETQQIEIFDDKGAAHPVRVPVSALRLLVDVLTEIGEGNAVSIIPIHADQDQQQAAGGVFYRFMTPLGNSRHAIGTRLSHMAV